MAYNKLINLNLLNDFLTKIKNLLSEKTDKVQSATNNNFAALDENGNLKDSGHKHDDYLTQHQSLAAYRTAAAQDTIDAGKQTKITASGMLKSNGEGSVSAATAGTDYETPAGAKTLGLTGTSAGDLVRVAAVDTNGKPTNWKKAPLCEIKTNPNQLDNWYFIYGKAINDDYSSNGTFPVNQKGQRGYTNSGKIYDRWVIENSAGRVNINTNDIWFYSNAVNNVQLYQMVDDSKLIDGATYTISVLVSNITSGGTFRMFLGGKSSPYPQLGTVDITSSGLIASTFTFNRESYTGPYKFILASKGTAQQSLWVKAVKLELGSEQTLAHQENGVWVLNKIPDYGQELAKCQRYSIVYKTSSNTRSFLALGFAESSSQYRAVLPTPVTMNHSTNRQVELTGTVTAGALTVSSVSSVWEENPGSITLFVDVTGATVGDVTKIMLEPSSTLTISAE